MRKGATVTELSLDEVYFEPGSVVDLVGKIFHYDGRIFRAVTSCYSEFIERTIELASQQKWSDVGLVPTWRTSFSLSGYSLVIEHKKVPFVTLRGEWSGEGLRNAALCILKVSAALLRSNLCLKDAHPWNILFDGTKPYWIDWGSIRPSSELNWEFWYGQFRQFLLAPLYAFSIGEHRIARAMLREHKVGVGNEIIQLPSTCNLPDAPRHIAESASSPPSPATFESLANYVVALTIPHIEGEWTAYEQPQLPNHADHSSLREKDRIVYRILDQDNGKTLIDVGTNNGLHSEIAAALGKNVLACEIEETCLNLLYARTHERGSSILPLYHDFLWPIGTSGILNTIPAAEDRLSCDTALVMAVTHHLVFKQHVSFEAMARGISSLAKRRAIVEFVPAEDEHVALWSPERLPWYNLDNFIAAMRQYFKSYSIIASEPRPRCVIVFEKV
jgi:hypothetical protein